MSLLAITRVLLGRTRAYCLRLRGANIGSKVTLGFLSRFDHPAGISIGHRSTTESQVWIKIESTVGKVRIGDHCFVGRNVEIDCIERVTIGDRTLIAPGVFITDHNHNIRGIGRIAEQGCISAPVHIGDDVWIGASAIILPGVTIGNGSVVGAGAVVTKSIPSLEIWAGVPARCIRPRTPE
jgi:acetyltransferase-like isoleucine patch superfamily enzyme